MLVVPAATSVEVPLLYNFVCSAFVRVSPAEGSVFEHYVRGKCGVWSFHTRVTVHRGSLNPLATGVTFKVYLPAGISLKENFVSVMLYVFFAAFYFVVSSAGNAVPGSNVVLYVSVGD